MNYNFEILIDGVLAVQKEPEQVYFVLWLKNGMPNVKKFGIGKWNGPQDII